MCNQGFDVIIIILIIIIFYFIPLVGMASPVLEILLLFKLAKFSFLLSSSVSVSGMMDTWTKQMDYPVLTISASNNQRATVSQRSIFLKEAQLHHHHSSECVCVCT